jgi:hypothetical protein
MKGEFEIMEFWTSGYSDGTSCDVYIWSNGEKFLSVVSSF